MLFTDNLQFGFKKGLRCSDAIYTLSQTIEYHWDRGSTVHAAELYISKAYECAIITSSDILIKAALPKCFIASLVT